MKEKIESAKTVPEKIKVVIISIIFDENCLTIDSLKPQVLNDCLQLGVFPRSKNPESRFDQVWREVLLDLEDEGKLSHIPEQICYIRPLYDEELERIITDLKEHDNPEKLTITLFGLTELAKERHISKNEEILNAIEEIILNNTLFLNQIILERVCGLLNQVFLYLSYNQPRGHQEIENYLIENHVKAISNKITMLDDLNFVNGILLILFEFIDSEIVVYTIFNLINQLEEVPYRQISSSCYEILFQNYHFQICKNFRKYAELIRKKIMELVESDNPEMRRRGQELYIMYNRKIGSLNV